MYQVSLLLLLLLQVELCYSLTHSMLSYWCAVGGLPTSSTVTSISW